MQDRKTVHLDNLAVFSFYPTSCNHYQTVLPRIGLQLPSAFVRQNTWSESL